MVREGLKRRYAVKMESSGGQLGGVVVKFTDSTLAAPGLQVQILGADLRTTHQAVLTRCPTYKIEEEWQRC